MGANIEYSRRERILALLGGERFIGLSANELDEPARLMHMIRDGLPVGSAQHVREHSGVPAPLFDHVVPRTTLISASKSKSKRLSKPVSEAVLRTVRVITMAEEAFGDRERAMRWLNKPNPVFEDEAPITLADTQSGADWVEQVLGRMMYGVDA